MSRSADRLLRVLVAEDDAEVVRRLVQSLEELPDVEIVGPAADGGVALDLMRARSPHVAVLDFSMPVANGLEVLRIIRRDNLSCIVIILTNYDEPSLRHRCLEAGADYFLHKSTEFETVADIIEARAARLRET